MKTDILQNVLRNLLCYYLNLDDSEVDLTLLQPNLGIKERVDTIDNLQVIIYSNDHDPPHFHVLTKDLRVDAKFKIENCELLSGTIGAKDLKKIRAFYLSTKGRMILETIWKKIHNG